MSADVTVIVQARLGSSRLPGKVLMPLGGIPVIDRVLQQLSFSHRASKIIVATTLSSKDDPLVEHLNSRGVPCFRGSEHDVLDRYYQCARSCGAYVIARITADCPLIDPYVLDQVIESFKRERVMYASNVEPATFPDGLDVEVLSFEALEWSWMEARLPSEREHVTQFVRKHPEWFPRITLESMTPLDHHRWTLDELSDHRFLSDLVRELPVTNGPVTMEMVLSTIERLPGIANANAHIPRNEGLVKSISNDPR